LGLESRYLAPDQGLTPQAINCRRVAAFDAGRCIIPSKGREPEDIDKGGDSR
jgi:hypothetical protein